MIKSVILAATMFVIAGSADAAPVYGVYTYALTADTQGSGFDYAAYNYRDDGGPFGVFARDRNGSQFASGAGDQPSTTGTFSGTISGDGYLTAAQDQTMTTRVDSGATATAFAAADLSGGTLRAKSSGATYVNGYTYDVSGRALAEFGDGLTFFVPGATVDTITDIGFTVTTDGTYGGGAGSFAESILAALSVSQAGNNAASYLGGYAMTNVAPPTMNYSTFAGWKSYSFSGGPGNYTFSGIYAAQGAMPYLTFGAALLADSRTGFADYANTSKISLQLPAGVSFASDSGVFLTPAGGAPEPASWAMMVIGLGLVGGLMRQQRRSSPARA